MIARCDNCDMGNPHPTGLRYDRAKGRLGDVLPRPRRWVARWVCPRCGGPLRAKRPGEHEANIIDARLVP